LLDYGGEGDSMSFSIKLTPINENQIELDIKEEASRFLRGFSVDTSSFFRANQNFLIGRFSGEEQNSIAFIMIKKTVGVGLFVHSKISSNPNLQEFALKSWERYIH